MTTYTVTTSQNVTALTAKAGGDTYNINGGTLTIDCDSRYGLNQGTTTGYLGPIAVSTTLGGTLKIDGTKVRLIPFNSGSGTVPAAGTTITQGSVTSELLGVWSAINTTPTAAGATMPTTGFLKVRNVSGGAGVYAAGALTGITATALRADIPGWIEVIGLETKTITNGRLGTVQVQGAWMSPFDTSGNEVQTSGSAGQSIQLPASVGATYYGGVFVETSSGSGVYQRWPNANGLVSSTIATDDRARQCWITPAGVLTFGSDGTNTVGLVPAAGCRIRVPNVLLGSTNSTVGFAANSTPNSTLTTRFGFATSAPFSIDIANVAWALNSSTAYSVSLTNSTVVSPTSLLNPTTPITVTGNIFTARDNSQADSVTMNTIQSYVGGSVTDNTFAAQTANTGFSYALVTAMTGGYFSRNRLHVMMVPTNTSSTGDSTISLTNMTEADGNEFICVTRAVTLVGTKLTNSKVATWAQGTAKAQASVVFSLASGCRDSVIDGVSFLISTANTCHPYTNWVNVSIPSNLKVRNFGTPTAPLSIGTVNPLNNLAFVTGFQASFTGCSLQKIYFSGTLSAAGFMGTYNAQKAFNVENCSWAASGQAFLQANSYIRAVRTTTIPTAQSGAAGLHWADVFLTDTTGALSIMMTDTTADTTDQVTVNAGTPRFTGSTSLLLANVSDSITWTMRYFAQGHTQLSSMTMSGGTITNYLVEFRVDVNDGTGWGAWQTASTTNLQAVTINPALGVKVAVRLTCTTATSTPITALRINTVSTLVAQQAVSYPLDPVTLSVSNIVAGSRVKVTRTDTNTVLDNAAVTGTSYSLTGDYTGVPVQVEVRCATPPGPYYQPWVGSGTVLSTGLALQALQVRDDQ